MGSRNLVLAFLASVVPAASCSLPPVEQSPPSSPAPALAGLPGTAPPGSAGGEPRPGEGDQSPAGATPGPDSGEPPISRFNTLSDASLGYLVANSGGALGGDASGPSALVGDNASLVNNTGGALVGNTGGALAGNAGGALIGNSGAGLIGNTGGALVGNTGGALAGNSGGSYRVAAAYEAVGNGFVYLTTPDERMVVNSDRRMISTLTDPDGTFAIFAPATESLVVNVLLKANRRMTALVDTTATASVKVDLASTLVTEYLRAKAAQYGFTFRDVMADAAARSALADLVGATRELVAAEAAVALFEPADLALNRLPALRHKYVVAFGTTSQAISDGWVALLKAVLDDPGAPDLEYRPLALTTIPTAMAPGFGSNAVAVAPDGAIYAIAKNPTTSELHVVDAAGARRLFVKASKGDDSLGSVLSLVAAPDGRILIPDYDQEIVSLFDPALPVANPPFMDKFELGSWTNPAFLFDVFTLPTKLSRPADVAVDDAAAPGFYLADAPHHAIWYVASAFEKPLKPRVPVAGSIVDRVGQVPAIGDPVPAATVAQVKLNRPTGVTHHRRPDGGASLFVADSGHQIVIEIDLGTGAVRRVAGVVPPYNGTQPRLAGCYAPAEEGGSALEAHLRSPDQVLVDAKERLLVADSLNALVRLVDAYGASPRIWTVAGRFQPDDGSCGEFPDVPPFALGDGEARELVIGEPTGMALDAQGNLILGDGRSNRLRKLWLSFLD